MASHVLVITYQKKYYVVVIYEIFIKNLVFSFYKNIPPMTMQTVYIPKPKGTLEFSCAYFNNYKVEFHIPFQGLNLPSISPLSGGNMCFMPFVLPISFHH